MMTSNIIQYSLFVGRRFLIVINKKKTAHIVCGLFF